MDIYPPKIRYLRISWAKDPRWREDMAEAPPACGPGSAPISRAVASSGEGSPLPRLPLVRKIAYGSGVFGISMAQMSVTVLMLYFYTDVLGFSPAQGGLILALGAIMDATASMSAAWISTKRWSRFGSYRPFLIYVPVPFALVFAAMFTKPDMPSGALFAYAFATHMAYRACYAFTLMPHSSLITRLSIDADERSSIGSVKAVMNNMGVLVAGYLGLGTIERLGNHDLSRGFSLFGIIFGAIAASSILIAGLFTPERVRHHNLVQDTSSLPAALQLMVRNGQLAIALTATTIFFVGYTMMNGGLIYYFKYIVTRPQDAKLAILCIGIAGILSPPLWYRLIKRTSKSVGWAIGAGVMAAAFLALLFFGARTTISVFAIYLVMGFGKTAMIVNYYALTADAVDYGQWKDGRRTEAYGFGMLSLSTKLGSAFAGAALGALLTWAGFVPNQLQSPTTLARMTLVVCAAPAGVIMLSGLVILFFRIDARRHRRMMSELANAN